jgi:ATP-dependent exoDNAse (exonuclease V) beta subunit
MKKLPRDQMQRDRFAEELDRNFSVTAAAGAGKTTAITDRIVQIAKQKPDWLPRLVVVTFTNRAADEMQQRARQRIFEAGVPLNVLAAFNRTFFGTIHSFCTKLLAAHGHHLGVPPRLDLISDDEELWNEFVQGTDSVGESLTPENRQALQRHIQVRDLMELGRLGRLPLSLEERDVRCPKVVDLARVRNYPARANATRIMALQKSARDWEEKFDRGDDFLPLIECTSEGRFREHWEEAFRDFYDWLSCCALKVAAEVQAKYREFRVGRRAVTFDDQIALALQLTENGEAIARIRAKDYIVVLDEAQDTDPQQFSVLTEITRPPNATGRWLNNLRNPPRAGRFCMVGDFQQSIYGDRADLKQYRRIHEALIASEAGEELKFSVTFRLDQRQVDFVNKCFRDILNDAYDQVGFIELNPRPETLPGQVVRLDITADGLDPDASEGAKARAEAAQLAKWLAQTGCERLRARSWEQVAILCPRKKWFAPIADALRKIDIDSQVQSETDVKADSPAHAWFTALVSIMTQPCCGFEIVGVLREVFGTSDHDLALFCRRDGDRFQIDTPSRGHDAVAQIVDLLAAIHAEVADKPLFTAVQRILEATHLRERLRTLPTEDFEDLDRELDAFLQSAAAAEAQGATLEEFAELLRANFTTEQETTVPRAGAIQLITCQKAKGLEWDAVIVPFFSRHVHTLDDDFPRIVISPHTRQAIVAFSKGDVPTDVAAQLECAQTQEMERLLYVALTRARHALVLAADRELFSKKHGDAHSSSLTTWFRADQGQANEPPIAQLETEATACFETSAHQMRSAQSAEDRQQIVPLPTISIGQAKARAEDFARIINPSGFAPTEPALKVTGADKWKEQEIELRGTTLPGPALRYGVWWHDFVQEIPWLDEGSWDKIFAASVTSSPDPARSKREWEMLKKHLANDADFRRRIAATVVHPEMPFFWRFRESKCLEGIVDLTLFNGDKALILDWKTNRIAADKIDNLRALYRPQIAAYWKAVAELTGLSVAAGIYSTSTGQFIEYDEGELTREWEQLCRLPPDNVAGEIALSG